MKILQISERLRWQGFPTVTTAQIREVAESLGFGDKRDYPHEEAMAIIRSLTGQKNPEQSAQQETQQSYEQARGAIVALDSTALAEMQQAAITRGQNAAISQLQNLATSSNALSLKAYDATIQAGLAAMDHHLNSFWGQVEPMALEVEAIDVTPTTTTFDCLAYGSLAGQLGGSA